MLQAAPAKSYSPVLTPATQLGRRRFTATLSACADAPTGNPYTVGGVVSGLATSKSVFIWIFKTVCYVM